MAAEAGRGHGTWREVVGGQHLHWFGMGWCAVESGEIMFWDGLEHHGEKTRHKGCSAWRRLQHGKDIMHRVKHGGLVQLLLLCPVVGHEKIFTTLYWRISAEQWSGTS